MRTALAENLFDNEYYSDTDIPSPQDIPRRVSNNEDTFTTGEDPDNENVSEQHHLVLPLQVLCSHDKRIILKRPLAIYLEGGHGQFVAFHEESRVCGEGKDTGQAISNFQETFVSVFQSYEDSLEPLSAG